MNAAPLIQGITGEITLMTTVCIWVSFFVFLVLSLFCYFKVVGFLKVVFSSTTELIKQAYIPSEEVLEATVAKFS